MGSERRGAAPLLNTVETKRRAHVDDYAQEQQLWREAKKARNEKGFGGVVFEFWRHLVTRGSHGLQCEGEDEGVKGRAGTKGVWGSHLRGENAGGVDRKYSASNSYDVGAAAATAAAAAAAASTLCGQIRK
jgi:hypothetical protein